MVKFKIDAREIGRRYGQALSQMAKLSGFPIEEVLKAEAGSILKSWAGKTKVATGKAITTRSRVRAARSLGFTKASAPGDVTVNAGLKGPYGRVWMKTKKKKWQMAMGPGFKPVGYHFKESDWIDVQEAVHDFGRVERKMKQQGRRSAGLARQSIIQAADALNIDLAAVKGGGVSASGIAKARRAMASDGTFHRNGTGRAVLVGGTERAVISMINSLPYNTGVGMDRTLLLIMQGRTKFFERNYETEVFKSLDKIAKAYPGLRVRA